MSGTARVLGVDLGERRIGLACSDRSGILASPLRTLVRGADHDVDHAAIVDVARAEGADTIVVGLPRSLSGREGRAARHARAEADALAARAARTGGITVELHDERLTTREAQRALTRSGRSTRAQRDVIDAAAAAVMLQSYLDSRPRSRA